MRAHLRYLRYVLIHKLYVFRAGLLLHRNPAWVARLLVHDLSKFRPSEWRPYVAMFYGAPATVPEHNSAARTTGCLCSACEAAQRAIDGNRNRARAFDLAWLKHQHRNPHHWQHYVLHQDDGTTKVLTMPAVEADEMLADWLGAGTKILAWPSMATCVAETIGWYAANHPKILIRDEVRRRVEALLLQLASDFQVAGTDALAQARASRSSLTL